MVERGNKSGLKKRLISSRIGVVMANIIGNYPISHKMGMMSILIRIGATTGKLPPTNKSPPAGKPVPQPPKQSPNTGGTLLSNKVCHHSKLFHPMRPASTRASKRSSRPSSIRSCRTTPISISTPTSLCGSTK